MNSESVFKIAFTFTVHNVIQNLQKFVTIGSKLIEHSDEKVFTSCDHLSVLVLVSLSVFRAHLILYSQMANQPSRSSG
jgi:hypothetical protein